MDLLSNQLNSKNSQNEVYSFSVLSEHVQYKPRELLQLAINLDTKIYFYCKGYKVINGFRKELPQAGLKFGLECLKSEDECQAYFESGKKEKLDFVCTFQFYNFSDIEVTLESKKSKKKKNLKYFSDFTINRSSECFTIALKKPIPDGHILKVCRKPLVEKLNIYETIDVLLLQVNTEYLKELLLTDFVCVEYLKIDKNSKWFSCIVENSEIGKFPVITVDDLIIDFESLNTLKNTINFYKYWANNDYLTHSEAAILICGKTCSFSGNHTQDMKTLEDDFKVKNSPDYQNILNLLVRTFPNQISNYLNTYIEFCNRKQIRISQSLSNAISYNNVEQNKMLNNSKNKESETIEQRQQNLEPKSEADLKERSLDVEEHIPVGGKKRRFENLQVAVGIMALLLAEKTNNSAYKRGDSPNATQIADAVNKLKEELGLTDIAETKSFNKTIKECVAKVMKLKEKVT